MWGECGLVWGRGVVKEECADLTQTSPNPPLTPSSHPVMMGSGRGELDVLTR